MKKFLLAILVAVCSLALFAACSDKGNNKKPDGESYVIELSQTALTLDVYEKHELTAVVKDGDGEVVDKQVEWKSGSAAIAEVEDGLLFAKSIGTAQITATVSGEEVSATVSVTVIMRGYVPTLRMDEEDSLTLSAGSSFDLNPRVYFKGAETDDSDTTFIYAVADTSVAKVENGTVSALKAGATQITVTASWRGLGGSAMTGSEDALGLRITLDLTVLTVD